MFKAQNATANIFIGVSIDKHYPAILTRFGNDIQGISQFPDFFERFRIAGVCSGSGDKPPE
jgi:hypothetical protein